MGDNRGNSSDSRLFGCQVGGAHRGRAEVAADQDRRPVRRRQAEVGQHLGLPGGRIDDIGTEGRQRISHGLAVCGEVVGAGQRDDAGTG